jgi:hypothetical protein
MTSNASRYVVQTQPHAEAKASAHLIRQRLEIYLTDRDRVAILLDLLGRKVCVFLDLDLVTAA